MLVIAILTIIAFVWLYNPTRTKGIQSNTVALIYGKSYSQADIDREVNNYRLTIAMGQFEMIRDLAAMAQSEDAAVNEFIVNLIVLQHQAEELGIEPTEQQIKKGIMSSPAFQTDGQFDPRKYSKLVDNELGPHGFTERQLESVVRDALNVERIKSVVTAPIAVSASEIEEACRMFQKVDAQKVKFSLLDMEMGMQVTDQEVQGAYERNKSSLVVPAMRTVQYVEFALPPAQAGLQGREKVDALQKVADTAASFATQAIKDFDSAAKAAGLAVKTTPEFDQSGFTKTSGQAAPDADQVTADIKGFAPSAFLLVKEKPVSDVVQVGDKFFVLKYGSEVEGRDMTLDEAKEQLVSRLRAVKAQRALQDAASGALAKIRESMKGGKSFADAAAEVGLKVETITGFDPASSDNSVDHGELAQATMLMQPGQLSNFLGTSDGGFAVFLTARTPLTKEELAKHREEIEPDILSSKQRILFATWLASAREAAKIQVGGAKASQRSGG